MARFVAAWVQAGRHGRCGPVAVNPDLSRALLVALGLFLPGASSEPEPLLPSRPLSAVGPRPAPPALPPRQLACAAPTGITPGTSRFPRTPLARESAPRLRSRP
ncbi:MAG: hypothetical protein ACREIU_12260, partial [Planctomycetota bacterium]